MIFKEKNAKCNYLKKIYCIFFSTSRVMYRIFEWIAVVVNLLLLMLNENTPEAHSDSVLPDSAVYNILPDKEHF